MTSQQTTILATWIPIIISWVGLALTGLYIKLTGEMVRQMRAAREPSVYADIEVNGGKHIIIVGNCGESPAVNIRFSFIGASPLRDINGIPSADKTLAQQPITFLAPNKILKFWAGYVDFNAQQPVPELVIRIAYENEKGKRFSRTCRINVLNLDNLLFETFRDSSQDIADAIREGNQEKSLKHFLRNDLLIPNGFGAQKQHKDKRLRVPCPTCSEMVLLDARKCRFCREVIDRPEPLLKAIAETDEVKQVSHHSA